MFFEKEIINLQPCSNPAALPHEVNGLDPPARNMRVLFLDVDGVVCCNRDSLLDPDKMEVLQKICEATGCKVCISSNWRLFDDLRQHLYQQLAHYKIECVGTTPDAGESQHGMPMRPCEIKAWMAEWNGQPADAKKKRPAITSFVALDDRPLMEENGGTYLHDHFVQTHPSVGLTEIAGARAIDLLLNPPAPTPRDHSPDSVLSSMTALLLCLPSTAPWDTGSSSPPKTTTTTTAPFFGLSASAHRLGLHFGVPAGRRPPAPQPRTQPFRAPNSAIRSDTTLAHQRPASSRLARPPTKRAAPTVSTGFGTPLNQPTVVKIRPLHRLPPNSAPNPRRLPPLMN